MFTIVFETKKAMLSQIDFHCFSAGITLAGEQEELKVRPELRSAIKNHFCIYKKNV